MKKSIFAIALVFFVAFMIVAAFGMRNFGEPIVSEMDDYYIQNAQAETGANNVVTTIVFDYRGFDTLGEATVLFTAVLGITALFREVAK
ncbi:MAG: hydrogen gas-evolving membrane-bound hydrogenase subunit E [Atribacterota bacterium]|jgi:multisubunit Na+/H+ antiporter MnhB subunit